MSNISPTTLMLLALQPPGILPNHPNTNWVKLLDALAAELERLYGRLDRLAQELTITDTALEMLEQWEHALGLPDPCAPAPTDVRLRRNRIRAKLSSVGGQNEAYYIRVVRQLGFDAYISELSSFEMGLGRMGDSIGGGEWNNTWQLNVYGNVSPNNQALIMCVINQIKPAHTSVVFSFGGKPPYIEIHYNGQLTYNGQANYGGY